MRAETPRTPHKIVATIVRYERQFVNKMLCLQLARAGVCDMKVRVWSCHEQARRLEELLSRHDTSHSALKDTMMSMVGNLAALGHSTASDEAVKNTFANFAFEHYEIASYSSLLTLAELAGDRAALATLNTSLREEKEMAQWIADHLDDTVRRFVG